MLIKMSKPELTLLTNFKKCIKNSNDEPLKLMYF